jgi:hypothetical protein
MSYDFSFMRLSPRPRELPFKPPMRSEWKIEALRAPMALEKFLVESGRARLNTTAGGRRSYRWKVSGEDFLEVSIGHSSIPIGVHAHWRDVAELYALLLPIEDDLLIVDVQTSMFYEAAAFGAFIEETYAKES